MKYLAAAVLALFASCAVGSPEQHTPEDEYVVCEGPQEEQHTPPEVTREAINRSQVYGYYVMLMCDVPLDHFVVVKFADGWAQYPVITPTGRLEIEDAVATTMWDPVNEVFVMELSSFAVNGPTTPHVMAHEWAHMMVWDACKESDHGPLWGVAFSRAYRALVQP